MIKIERLHFRYIWSMMTRSVHECWHVRTNKCVRNNICKKSVFVVFVRNINICGRIPRPSSPIWDKWNGSSWQTPCPCPTCPTKISRPPSPCSTCRTKIWRPPSPCHTCPTTPTCPNLSHLVVPLVLYQLSFLRFFLGFSASFHFSKKLLNERFSSKYYHVGEGINDNQISTKRQETTVTIHSNTLVYFV